ncbi:MAG: hypothetical protein ACRC8P_00335 [Spiroplasma sp.]
MNINEERQFRILEWVWNNHSYYFLDNKLDFNNYELKTNFNDNTNTRNFTNKADAILKPKENFSAKKYFIQNVSFSHTSKNDNFRKEESNAYKRGNYNKNLINQINSQEQGKLLIESLLFELKTEIQKKLEYNFNLNENEEAILFIICHTRLMFENNSAKALGNIIFACLHNNFRANDKIYNYSKIIIVFNMNALIDGHWFSPIIEINFKTGKDKINEPKIFQIKLNLIKHIGYLDILESNKNFVYQNISMNPFFTKKINKIKS